MAAESSKPRAGIAERVVVRAIPLVPMALASTTAGRRINHPNEQDRGMAWTVLAMNVGVGGYTVYHTVKHRAAEPMPPLTYIASGVTNGVNLLYGFQLW